MKKILHFVFGIPLTKTRKIIYCILFLIFLSLGILLLFTPSPDQPVITLFIIANFLWLYFATSLIINGRMKFTGIALAAIVIILLLIIGYTNGKRFLKRMSYQDCPSYIFVVAEFIETKIEIPVVQEKINNLKIGDVIVKPEGENKVLISVQNDNTLFESEHQALVAVLQELGLQETGMKGSGVYKAKTCNSVDDLMKRNP